MNPDVLPKPPTTSSPADWIARHQRQIWRFLRFLGCPEDRADDLLQEVLLAALERGIPRPGSAAGSEEGAAWLRATARNLYYAECRKNRRERIALADAEAAFARHADPDGGESYLRALETCLGTLDAREREAIHLRYREAWSRERIASHLKLAPEGAKSLLRRVRERLRVCIETRRQSE